MENITEILTFDWLTLENGLMILGIFYLYCIARDTEDIRLNLLDIKFKIENEQ